MLQTQTVRPDCLALLNELMQIDELKDFKLAGGTGLSLLLGHRISIDLDLFTNQLFDISEFQTFLMNYFQNRIHILGSNRYGIFTIIDNIKVDLVYRHEKLRQTKFADDEIVRIVALEDIAAMKILAAADRGSKKDYYDLFELLNVYTFVELLNHFTLLYPNYGKAGILKNISDFKDAESEQDPISLKSISWIDVSGKIGNELRNYIHLLQQKQLEAQKEKEDSIKRIINKRKYKN